MREEFATSRDARVRRSYFQWLMSSWPSGIWFPEFFLALPHFPVFTFFFHFFTWGLCVELGVALGLGAVVGGVVAVEPDVGA